MIREVLRLFWGEEVQRLITGQGLASCQRNPCFAFGQNNVL